MRHAMGFGIPGLSPDQYPLSGERMLEIVRAKDRTGQAMRLTSRAFSPRKRKLATSDGCSVVIPALRAT